MRGMNNPAASALAVMLFGLSAVFVFAAAGKWLKLANRAGAASIPVHAFRSAASLTAVALGMIGASLLLAAILSL